MILFAKEASAAFLVLESDPREIESSSARFRYLCDSAKTMPAPGSIPRPRQALVLVVEGDALLYFFDGLGGHFHRLDAVSLRLATAEWIPPAFTRSREIFPHLSTGETISG